MLAATLLVALLAPGLVQALPASASDDPAARPDLVALLAGYSRFWAPTSPADHPLHGIVRDARVLRWDDELTVWINRHATETQRFRALQDAEYQPGVGGAYDQSVTISTGLGSVLGPLYVAGYQGGRLPLTVALLNATSGTSGAYVTTGAAKYAFSHPRPYLPSDPTTPSPPGEEASCPSAAVNGSSQRAIRLGEPWADARGNLRIRRVDDVVDTTHEFSPNDVALSANYGGFGTCRGGSFPSGHTTTAYEAGITLATLLPELAPEILARASEAGNDRIVLGVHYPLDVVGGRIDGEAAIAARWSDPAYRARVLEPARTELVAYLEAQCRATLAACIRDQDPYRSDPYGGAAMPGGSSQRVDDRASAAAVFRERLTYGFPRTAAAGRAPDVPAGASALLITTFPTLTSAQRTSVLAQTQLDSGYPLDGTGTAAGSWQRLDLAAAMSATVRVDPDGSVAVVATGGVARVLAPGSDGRSGSGPDGAPGAGTGPTPLGQLRGTSVSTIASGGHANRTGA